MVLRSDGGNGGRKRQRIWRRIYINETMKEYLNNNGINGICARRNSPGSLKKGMPKDLSSPPTSQIHSGEDIGILASKAYRIKHTNDGGGGNNERRILGHPKEGIKDNVNDGVNGSGGCRKGRPIDSLSQRSRTNRATTILERMVARGTSQPSSIMLVAVQNYTSCTTRATYTKIHGIPSLCRI